MQRRAWLKAAAALAAAGVPLSGVLPAAGMGSAPNSGRKVLGKPQPFDYAWLKGRARTLAGTQYQTASGSLHPDVAKLDWDGYQAIRYRDTQQLWTNGDSRFRAAFFHLGLFFTTPVHLHEVVNG